MSKYVQMLLTFRDEIKSKSIEDSDLYDDLLTVEQKIKELYNDGRLSDFDLVIINYVSSRNSFRNLEKMYNISRITISTRFKKVCERIAYYLGDYFTDFGYIRKLKQKYNLTNQEVIKLMKIFEGSNLNEDSL